MAEEPGQISTRTPHTGSDDGAAAIPVPDPISTRTPHAGSDVRSTGFRSKGVYFNPHSPCGE